MFYGEDIIEEVRSRNDIVDVIGGYVSLRQRGSTYSCCCPFHQEKTPSFHVNRQRQMYKCFGCGEGGNVLTFVMKYENLSFPEALQLLAGRAGIALPEKEQTEEERRRADYRTTLLEMNKHAAAYFHYLLKQKNGAHAYEYLKKRGIDDETVKKFALGYSDITRDDLYRYLRHKGYTDAQLKDSGLVEIDEKRGAHDKFWNRVMYPILDANSRVIGFGGRVMGDGEPKYLNSKETLLFDKRRNLYGLYLAKKSKRDGIILCEGYMDVISMHQAGFDNAVASLGTAFTMEQATLLKRYTDKIYLAYDSDGAGVKAAGKAIDILKNFTYSVRVISMKPHKDPDEFIQELGVEAFEERISNAKSAMEFQMEQTALRFNMDDPEERTRFQRALVDLLVTLEEPLERENYIETAARLYSIDKQLLRDAVNKQGYKRVTGREREPAEHVRGAVDRQKAREEKEQIPHKLLLSYLVEQPDLIARLSGVLGKQDFYQDIYSQVAEAIYSQYEKTKTVMPASILNQFTDMEAQQLAAQICQTTLKFEPDAEAERQVLTDLVRKVKLASIEHALATSEDMERWQVLLKQKADILSWQLPNV